MKATTDVELQQEVVIVLAAGFTKNGSPSQATVLRADAGVELVRAHPNTTAILSGGRKEARAARVQITDAEAMAAILEHEGIPSSQVLLEMESHDLVGQAVLSCARFLAGVAPRKVSIITSPDQIEHALAVFRLVLPTDFEVKPVVTYSTDDEDEVPADDAQKQADLAFFAGITPGDYQAMLAKLRASSEQYANLV